MNYQSGTGSNQNPHYSPYAKAKVYGEFARPISSQFPQFRQYRKQNQSVRSGVQQSSGSRISQLNDRLSHETDLIKLRNDMMRKSIRSTSSQLKKSRMSADRKRKPAEFVEYGRGSNYLPLRYQSQTESLASSRASQDLLRKPIISHAREPITFSGEVPDFRKQKNMEYTEQISRSPILQSNRNQSYQMKSLQNEAVPYFKTSNQYPMSSSKRSQSIKNEQFEQFLDMDFNKDPPMQSFRSHQQEQEPVSPVTYNNSAVQKHQSEKPEPESLPLISPKVGDRGGTSLVGRVGELMQRSENEGKIITLMLVGIGIILVIFQLIR